MTAKWSMLDRIGHWLKVVVVTTVHTTEVMSVTQMLWW